MQRLQECYPHTHPHINRQILIAGSLLLLPLCCVNTPFVAFAVVATPQDAGPATQLNSNEFEMQMMALPSCAGCPSRCHSQSQRPASNVSTFGSANHQNILYVAQPSNCVQSSWIRRTSPAAQHMLSHKPHTLAQFTAVNLSVSHYVPGS